MNCINCNAAITGNPKFCPNCGQQIELSKKAEDIEENTAYTAPIMQSESEEGHLKKKRFWNKKLLWAFGGILLLAGLAIIGFFYFKMNVKANVCEYYAVKIGKEDRWSIINNKGEIVVDGEWENEPYICDNGIVLTTNSKRKFEFYTIEKKPKQIGGTYANARIFVDGLAPVCEENKHISYINTKGTEEFELQDINGKEIIAATTFSDNVARIQNEDNLWGCINKEGKVEIPCVYDYLSPFDGGYAIAKKMKGKEMEYGIIDKKNRVIIKFKSNIRYNGIRNGIISYSDNTNFDEWGLMDLEGEKILKASSKFKDISKFNNGLAVFRRDDAYGVINEKGDIIVNAKYRYILIGESNILVKKESEDDSQYGYLDFEGNEIIKPDFSEAYLFNGQVAMVKDGNRFSLIDLQGKAIGKEEFTEISKNGYLFDFVNNPDFNYSSSDFVIGSDYFELEKFVTTIEPTKGKFYFGNLSRNSTFMDIDRILKFTESLKSQRIIDTAKTSGLNDPFDYLTEYQSAIYVSNKEFKKNLLGNVYIYFSDNIKIPNILKTPQTVVTGYNQLGDPINNTIYTEKTTGYKLNPDAKLQSIRFEYDLKRFSKYYEKFTQIGNAFISQLRQNKQIVWENSNGSNWYSGSLNGKSLVEYSVDEKEKRIQIEYYY